MVIIIIWKLENKEMRPYNLGQTEVQLEFKFSNFSGVRVHLY